MSGRLVRFLSVCFLYLALPPAAGAQAPVPFAPDVEVRLLVDVDPGAVRLAHDPATGDLFYLHAGGDVSRIRLPDGTRTRVLTAADHGIAGVQGFTIGPDGSFFLVGNAPREGHNVGRIVRGMRTGGGVPAAWTTLAQTQPYPLSNTPFDHLFNGIVVSPDGGFVHVNSGSRTDHGEVQPFDGLFPGTREVPLTSAILRLPADAVGLELPNDQQALRDAGILFADGVRNSFDLAFAPNGDLFATENSGDRDDSDELNWLREGHHYGFPWRMGTSDTPQQIPGYDPGADLLVNRNAFSFINGFFHDDPSYPPPPDGVVFTDPVLNVGPDADRFRDPDDGTVEDASDLGVTVGTFTAHRSPLGLAFDRGGALAEPYRGDGFVLGWTGEDSDLLGPMGDPGEDLLHLALTKVAAEDRYEVRARRLVAGFRHPIDAVLVGHRLYVLEFGSGGTAGLWEVVLPAGEDTAAEEPTTPPHRSVRLNNFPNPAGGATTIRYELVRPGLVELRLLDVLGRTVYVLDAGWRAPGPHETAVDLSGLPAGIYLYRLSTARQVVARRMAVVR